MSTIVLSTFLRRAPRVPGAVMRRILSPYVLVSVASAAAAALLVAAQA